MQKAITNLDAEILVIDNNSTDDSVSMVKTYFPQVRLIENTENVGFAKANNQAVRHAKGEYVCILNPDTVVAEDTFSTLLEFASKTADLGALGCKLVDGKGTFLPESKRNLPVIRVAFQKQMGNTDMYYANHVGENDIAQAPILVGAFMLMKRSVYNELDGFDEDYFMYGEDIDLSYRLENSGYRNYYHGQCTVIHFKGESTLKDKTYAKRFFGAMHIFYQKHFKHNWFDSSLIWLASKMAKLLSSEAQEEVPQVNKYVLVSNKEYPSLSSKLEKPFEQTQTVDKQYNCAQLILDANYLTYKQVIGKISDNQYSTDCSFKILPLDTNFIVGSYSSKTRGEVLVF